MNRSSTRRIRFGTILGAFALTLVTACGADVATAPSQINQPEQRQGPQPGSTSQQCHGAPQAGGVVCKDGDKLKAKPEGSGDSGLARHGSGPEGWS